MDNEFKPTEYKFKDIDITMNWATEIVRAIRTIKEIFKALYHQFQYNSIPKNMSRYRVKAVVKFLTMFPSKGRVSMTCSTRAI